ncbi:MAG: hypothetical protein IJU16_02175 [Clostridia bacterium]|nr:hypothetical protein [Clostridia bacterium]
MWRNEGVALLPQDLCVIRGAPGDVRQPNVSRRRVLWLLLIFGTPQNGSNSVARQRGNSSLFTAFFAFSADDF